jgi:hypothetical protein
MLPEYQALAFTDQHNDIHSILRMAFLCYSASEHPISCNSTSVLYPELEILISG